MFGVPINTRVSQLVLNLAQRRADVEDDDDGSQSSCDEVKTTVFEVCSSDFAFTDILPEGTHIS